MSDFLTGLDAMEKFFAACAATGGLLFILRTLLMVIGHHGDTDADMSSDFSLEHGDADASVKLLSIQGLTGFFMMFGLVGLALSKQSQVGQVGALAGGLIAGSLTLWVIARIFLGMKKLQADGTLNLANAVGGEGSVYLSIPPQGTGKVQINVQGRQYIFDAVSDHYEAIKTGERVKVDKISNGNILVVKKA